ncbi:MAG: hypothetical protein Q4G18_11595 [Myroides sp.]|nr:hypothetical protein [Myroides sp.]
MKNNYLPFIIIGSLLLITTSVIFFTNHETQNIDKSNEFTVNETIPTTTETNDSYVPEPVNNTKFVLLVYKVEAPYLAYQPSFYTPMNVLVEEVYYLDWLKGEAPSDVMEFKYFSSDNAYKLLDEHEKYVTITPEEFKKDVEVNIKDYSYKSYLLNLKVKIIDRYYLTFDSYGDASIKRQEIIKTHSN